MVITGIADYYNNGYFNNTNTGAFWTSVYTSSGYIQYSALYYYGNYTYFTSNNNRRTYGIPVRCIARTE